MDPSSDSKQFLPAPTVWTPRERVRAVYAGQTPDRVPLLLDLSHWYKKNHGVFFDLRGFTQVEPELVELHKKCGAVLYIETGNPFDIAYEDDSVFSENWTDDHGVFHTRITTPLGTICEERIFNPDSYSYHIHKWLVQDIRDLAVLEYALSRRSLHPRFERYLAWNQAAGDLAFPYVFLSYSGLGFLISRYMGIERTILAIYDYPQQVERFIRSVNACNLRLLDQLIDQPFDVLLVGDNHDSSVQSPDLFKRFTFDYYSEIARRLHAHGKYLAVHVDGEMRGLLQLLDACGVDCIDAATPSPMFSLTPENARAQAGDRLILSGGIPATVFGAGGSDAEFIESVKRWLDIRLCSPHLFLAAGDQVPPDAPWHRIEMLSELVDRYGRY
ncbi:hypothetical protein JW992_07135 [candidate division KSB1 bacterium]|nr:hypothetical protein [candidate division KSB1 bacterium]